MEIFKLILENKSLVSLLIAIASSPLVIKIINKIINKIIETDHKKNKPKVLRFKDSELFYVLKKSAWDVSQKVFQNDYKTAVGRDLLRIKFERSYEVIKQWIEDYNEEKVKLLSREEVKLELFDLLRKIISTYEKEWKLNKINEKIIEQFNSYHRGNEQWVMITIENQINDDMNDNVHIVYYSLKAFANAYNRAFFDADELFRKMNGSLTGDVYKGIQCV